MVNGTIWFRTNLRLDEYPKLILDFKESRLRAIQSFKEAREAGNL